jgi:hypothetical protein
MHEPENPAQNVHLVGIALELDQFSVDDGEALIGLGEEFREQIVHGAALALKGLRQNGPE